MTTELLNKYIAGYASAYEKEIIIKWLDADEAHMREYLSLRRLYDMAVWTDNNSEKAQKKSPLSIIKQWGPRIAASLLILLSFGYLTFNLLRTEQEATHTITVPLGQCIQLALADGSSVMLNAKSSLTLPTTFNEKSREVFLDGEAFFKVKASDKKPFIVTTQYYKVTAKGTEFNVSAYKNQKSRTYLFKGKVSINLNKEEDVYDLKPNQQFIWDDHKVTIEDFETSDCINWIEGIITINNLAMQDLFEQLELYYGVKITVNKKDLKDENLNGKFYVKDGIQHILRVLQIKYHFNYTIQKNEIIIY